MQILDTTIRDGSYAVDFKFSCADVKKVVSRLEKLGFEYIEIGHGMGLNASSSQHGLSLHTDLEYMEVAQKTLKKAKFGFFCIPGIARLEDIAFAKENGVSFIRIGIEPKKIAKAIPYIEEAKKQGLIVMVNFMKTYSASYELVAECAKNVQRAGAEFVYIVDSAGCMLPQQIEKYYKAIKNKCNVKIGFHGHNNLGLAVSNTVFCAELGFDIVDCSLQGLGRSIGNASSEQVIMTLQKKGMPLNYDIPRLLEYGYVLLRDIVGEKIQNPLDLVCGYADFHSGYIKDIYKCSNEFQVDPLRLIIHYGQTEKGEMDYEKLTQIAQTLPIDEEENPYSFREFFSELYNDEE